MALIPSVDEHLEAAHLALAASVDLSQSFQYPPDLIDKITLLRRACANVRKMVSEYKENAQAT